MLTSTLLTTFLLALPLPALGFSDRAHHEQSRSRARAHYRPARAAKDLATRDVAELAKRDSYNGRATFYDVGLGACGWTNVASDYIVAQNSDQYGSGYPGPNCGRSISISYGGKTLTATIADECPTCPYGGLDMSRGLFDAFAAESVGEFYMTWWYNDETTTSTSATPTSTYVAPSTSTTPTSTWVAPTTTSTTPTSTWVAPSTTSTSTTSSTWSSSSSSSTSSFTTSSSSSSIATSIYSSAAATTTGFGDAVTTNATDVASLTGASASATGTGTKSAYGAESTAAEASLGNLVLFNQAVAYLGHIVVVGAEK